MITSSTNAKVKQVVQWREKARERHRDRVFIAEGFKMFEEAPEESIQEVYVSSDALAAGKNHAFMREKLERTGYELVSPQVLAKMSDTKTPQGILTVVRQPRYEFSELLKAENPLLVVLESLQDPGNLGTIVRTGEGAGITGVILTAGTVDLFNPKVIRATMGSIYRVPFVCEENTELAVKKLRGHGISVFACHLEGKTYYDNVSFAGPSAFLIGNEGRGLTAASAALADLYLKIPMEGRVESLNASIAAALVMYEAHRQRSIVQ